MNILVNRIEEISINAFPALQTELYDGWILRFSDGYTSRGNCVNPLYPSMLDTDEKLTYCEKKYFSKGLPCIYKLTECSPPGLDERLEALGYQRENEVRLMTMARTAVPPQCPQAELSESMTDLWLSSFLELKGTGKPGMVRAAKRMLKNISNPIFCATVTRSERIVGCGLGVLERGFLGLFDLYVDSDFRRQGIGGEICNAILGAGIRDGAEMAYLQVSAQNEGAIGLYRNMGFSPLYSYWYRVKHHTDFFGETKSSEQAK